MKRLTMHVPRARDSCTSYATENADYLTVTDPSVRHVAQMYGRVTGESTGDDDMVKSKA
jgi:hypothetical protein